MPRKPRHAPAAKNIDARFAEVVHAFEAPLSRYLVRMVGDPELARDLTQETFLSAYSAWPDPEPAHLSAWLYRIATNHALSHLRRRKVIRWIPFSHLTSRRQSDAGAPGDEIERLFPNEASPADGIVEADTISAILDAMDPKDRATLLLHASGFSGAEIGEQLNCTAASARTRLSRARAQFREQYTRLAALSRAGDGAEHPHAGPVADVVPHPALLRRRGIDTGRPTIRPDAGSTAPDDDETSPYRTGGSNA